MLNELFNERRRTSMASLGKIKFEYMGNTDKILNKFSHDYGIEKSKCKMLLDYIVMTIAHFGALEVDDDLKTKKRKKDKDKKNDNYIDKRLFKEIEKPRNRKTVFSKRLILYQVKHNLR